MQFVAYIFSNNNLLKILFQLQSFTMFKIFHVTLIMFVALMITQPVAAQQEYNASVLGTVSGLRLRSAPSESSIILTVLAPLTQLRVIGRTSDNGWLEVFTPANQRGWVARVWTVVQVSLSTIPVSTSGNIVAPSTSNATTSSTGTTSGSTSYVVRSGDTLGKIARNFGFTLSAILNVNPGLNPDRIYIGQQLRLPTTAATSVTSTTTGVVNSTASTSAYLTNITPRARQIFLQGQSLGNNARAFVLVGDSNSESGAFLTPYDQGNYTLGIYSSLQPTVDYFQGSFGRVRVAARPGFNSGKVLKPENANKSLCLADESPLVCDYRLARPSVALILMGTNDQYYWWDFEKNYRQIVEYSLSKGIVPVLTTKIDDTEANTAGANYINNTIRKLSQEYSVPLLDLRQAVTSLPNRGLLEDGFHINLPPDGKTGVFDTTHLMYGYTMRNLITLQALTVLRSQVLN